MEDIQPLFDHACETARLTGRHAKDQGARRREVDQSLKHDIKLVMDRECQTLAEESVAARFPDHRILCEEGTIEKPSDYTWVIDPIDGTMNYFHGLTHWCCSIAVMKGEALLAGAVYLPETDELFAAARGIPATRNGEVIGVSTTATLEESLVLAGLGKPLPDDSYDVRAYARLARDVQKTRVMGAAAIDLCLVACGRADAYCDCGIALWDYAAAQLIVEQAGGTFEITDHHAAGTQIVCSNGRIHEAVRTSFLG